MIIALYWMRVNRKMKFIDTKLAISWYAFGVLWKTAAVWRPLEPYYLLKISFSNLQETLKSYRSSSLFQNDIPLHKIPEIIPLRFYYPVSVFQEP